MTLQALQTPPNDIVSSQPRKPESSANCRQNLTAGQYLTCVQHLKYLWVSAEPSSSVHCNSPVSKLFCGPSQSIISINPFQSNFSANCILPSSYLLWAGKRLVDYLLAKVRTTRGKVSDRLLQRSGRTNAKKKCRTDSCSGEGKQTQKKKCRTSPDIGAEWENHNVRQGPT